MPAESASASVSVFRQFTYFMGVLRDFFVRLIQGWHSASKAETHDGMSPYASEQNAGSLDPNWWC